MKQNAKRTGWKRLVKPAAGIALTGALMAGGIGAGLAARKLQMEAKRQGLEEIQRGKSTRAGTNARAFTAEKFRQSVSTNRLTHTATSKFALTEDMKLRFERAMKKGFGIDPASTSNAQKAIVDKAVVQFVFEQSKKLQISPDRVLFGIYLNIDALTKKNRESQIRKLLNARDGAIRKGNTKEAEGFNRQLSIISDIDPAANPLIANRLHEACRTVAREFGGYSVFAQEYSGKR